MRDHWLHFLSLLLFVLFLPGLIFAGDFISITAGDTIEIDNKTGIVLINGNVEVVQNSTHSTLSSSSMTIKKDLKSGTPVWMEALGEVKIRFNELNLQNQPQLRAEVNSVHDKLGIRFK